MNYTMSEDSLCEELMVEILTRLPPTSLVRFRSVSKSLRSLIDSPDFIRMHTARSPKSVIITHMVRFKFMEEYGAKFLCTVHAEDQLPLCGYIGIPALKFPHRQLSITGSCNGIICLFDSRTHIIFLWNPSIMRQLTLPDCPLNSIYGIGTGIGFDPTTDDNKVVSIPLYGAGNGDRTFVYAMKKHAWHPITSPMPLYNRVLSRSCYLNGVLHWVVALGEARFIMTVDLRTHVFGMIALPKSNWETQNLTTIQGSLAVISRVIGDTWIWVRRDASWSLFFKTKTNQVQGGLTTFLELTNNGDLLLDTFEDGFQVYNPKTGARSTLVNFNDDSYVLHMNTYVETLHLLDMGTACELNLFLEENGKKEKVNLATSFRSVL